MSENVVKLIDMFDGKTVILKTINPIKQRL